MALLALGRFREQPEGQVLPAHGGGPTTVAGRNPVLFAAIALLLAAVGIYGLIAYSVAQRTHEIGVRMALGAARADVVRMVVRQGARLAAIGIALGLGGALALTRLLKTMLFGIGVTDALTFAAAPLGMMLVVLLATFVPAIRATRISPVVALRYE